MTYEKCTLHQKCGTRWRKFPTVVDKSWSFSYLARFRGFVPQIEGNDASVLLTVEIAVWIELPEDDTHSAERNAEYKCNCEDQSNKTKDPNNQNANVVSARKECWFVVSDISL